MTGILQDKLYIEQLNEAISLSEKTQIFRVIDISFYFDLIFFIKEDWIFCLIANK